MTDDSTGQVPQAAPAGNSGNSGTSGNAGNSDEVAAKNKARVEISVPPRVQPETPARPESSGPAQSAAQTGASAEGQSAGNPITAPANEPLNSPINQDQAQPARSPQAQPAANQFATPPSQGEPVNFVAFGTENATFDDDGNVSEENAFVADANSGKSDIEFAGSVSNGGDSKADDEIEKGLAQIDPLTVHPRISSCVLALVLALLCFASAAAIYWFGVHTLEGQSFDEIVWQSFKTSAPSWIIAVSHVFNRGVVIVVVSLTIAVLAFIIAAVRKRWWLVGQMAVFGAVAYGAAWLKRLLPRPMIIRVLSSHENSAPSGHTLLAVGSVLVLLVAVPRVWRALVALLGSAYSILVAASVIVGRWHRPSDVLMSLLIGGGLMLLALVFTRKSGMDSPGSRMSSAGIQIIGSIMITFGVVSCAYAGYMLWQIYPGLEMMAVWAKNGACALTMAAILGVGCLMFGLTLAMRQLTASPLTRLGLVGAPPAPPQE
ncbi:phosphatase PAP2 family protein [Bifidobacterium sp. ESL0728]|uniref:phosphatase PAP2 family protein n=1 Tax=Bifidobacterium sp. ESL0728 TaxID=2983220 RepID=UPI0023F73EB9|nr:phosphatase PAP2 family protein [Bifidobacterium sp. ESL0728]WEV58797.1 phosphatase PAP2 family protein [Bifidobacterium sp. ESL0728]